MAENLLAEDAQGVVAAFQKSGSPSGTTDLGESNDASSDMALLHVLERIIDLVQS